MLPGDHESGDRQPAEREPAEREPGQRRPPARVSGAQVLHEVERTLIQYFEGEPRRASVSFVGVERLEVLRFERFGGGAHYVTLGMSRMPMTGAEALVTEAEGPRAELVLEAGVGGDAVWSQLAVLAACPAVEGVVYRPGMSVDLGAPLLAASTCTGVLVTDPLGPPVGTPAGPVELLTVVAATPAELAWCRVRGAAALRERWSDQRIDLTDLARSGADLG